MLKRRAVAATAWSAVEHMGTKGLSTLFMLLFARLLTPADFGVFAAGTLTVGLASRVGLLGLDTVVVQRKELGVRALSTSFWMCLITSIVLALFLIALATPISTLFGNTRVASILPFLAFGMVISSVTTMLTSLLRRNLNMKALAKRTLIANAISGIIAIAFVWNGAGLYALVVQSVGGAIINLILTMLLTGWPIRFVFDGGMASDMIHFGMPVTGADLLTYYNRECPTLFIGFFLGLEALGIYSMAARFMNLLLDLVGTTLSRVTLPVIAEVNRSKPDRVLEVYLRLVKLASAVILPSFVICISLREELVLILLGRQWIDAAPVSGFLLGAGILTALNYVNGSTLVAIGKPRARLWFSSLRAIVGTTLLLFATPFGLAWSALALLLRGAIVEPLQLLYLLRHLKARLRDYLRQNRRVVLAAIVLHTLSTLVRTMVDGAPIGFIVALCTLAGFCGYFMVLWLSDQDLIRELSGMAKSVRSS